MSRDAEKRRAAEAALEHVAPQTIIGIGTGSTTEHFLEALAEKGPRIRGGVPSSERTREAMSRHDIPIVELHDVEGLPLYVDGADEATRERVLIKGGGGALTREKIIAEASSKFVCIVDSAKLVMTPGRFPLAVEVIPMARRQIMRQLKRFGAVAEPREGFVTDNGNEILDLHGLEIVDPIGLEQELDAIPGLVCHGLFCRRRADLLLVGTERGVDEIL